MQGLYLALVFVPLLSNYFRPSLDSLLIYLAAICLAFSAGIYLLSCPRLTKFPTSSEAKTADVRMTDIVEYCESENIDTANIQEPAVQINFDEPETTSKNYNSSTFLWAKNRLDGVKPRLRWLGFAAVFVAGTLLLIANAHRAYIVYVSFTGQTPKFEARMNDIYILGVKLGEPVTIFHDDGSANPKKTKGKIIILSEDGSVTLVTEDGKTVHIPGSKVFEINQSLEINRYEE